MPKKFPGRIMVVSEKNYTDYYDIDTNGKYLDVCSKLVEERHEQGLYLTDGSGITTSTDELNKQLAKLQRNVGTVGINKIEEAISEEVSNVEAEIKSNEYWIWLKELVEKALSGNRNAAYEIIQDRNGCTYEGFEIQTLTKV